MGLLITAMIEGFRRAGVAHSTAGTYWPEGSFTEAQLQQLRSEPKLVVLEGVQPPQELEKELADEENAAPGPGAAEAPGTAPTEAPATQPAEAVGAKAPAVKNKGGAKTTANKPAAPTAPEAPKGDEGGKSDGSEDAGE